MLLTIREVLCPPVKKEKLMNNILFFLTPKAMCAYLYDDYTVRQALEKMEAAGYAALPIVNRRGEYRGTLQKEICSGPSKMCAIWICARQKLTGSWRSTADGTMFRFG